MNRQQAMWQARQASINTWAQAQRQALQEAVRNTPVNPAQAAGASGVGGGITHPDFTAFVTDNAGITGYYANVDTQGNVSPLGSSFDGITVFCKNPDTGKTYYITANGDTERMEVGIIDTTTGAKQLLDTTVLNAASYKRPCSLFYVGNNRFLYLDNNTLFGAEGDDIQRVFLLQITDAGVFSIVGGSALCQSDISETSIILTTAFKVEDQYWVTFTPYGFPLLAAGELNIATGEVNDYVVIDLEGFHSDSYKAWFTLGISQSASGKLYANLVVNDKIENNLYSVIAEYNVATNTMSWVQDIQNDYWTPLDIEAK